MSRRGCSGRSPLCGRTARSPPPLARAAARAAPGRQRPRAGVWRGAGVYRSGAAASGSRDPEGRPVTAAHRSHSRVLRARGGVGRLRGLGGCQGQIQHFGGGTGRCVARHDGRGSRRWRPPDAVTSPDAISCSDIGARWRCERRRYGYVAPRCYLRGAQSKGTVGIGGRG
eukprot:COSAG01_NODE_1517_length_10050_cov_2.477640_5_plen_170_part_00